MVLANTSRVLCSGSKALKQAGQIARASTATSTSTVASTSAAAPTETGASSSSIERRPARQVQTQYGGGGGQRHKTYSASQIERMPPREKSRSTYLILKEVPRTALPTDVLRALRDVGAVDKDFPLSAITAPPPSLPRSPGLTRSWHLSFSSHTQVVAVHKHLSAMPLFGSSSLLHQRASVSSSSSSFSSPSYPSSSASAPNQYAQYTESPAQIWMEDMIRRSLSDGNMRAEHRDKAVPDGFTAEWCAKSGYSGRRVVIRGLPGSVTYEQVRRLAKDCGVVEGEEGCKRLPPSKFSLVSTFCVTTNSVAEAYRLVRKIHMKWYKSSTYGEKYLMRAEVAY